MIFDPNDPFVKWPYALRISGVSGINNNTGLFNALAKGDVNATLDKAIVELNCNDSANKNLTVSLAGSECGYISCPYNPNKRAGALEVLFNALVQFFPNIFNYFTSLFGQAPPDVL